MSVNVKKTKSSKKIVLKITMSMTGDGYSLPWIVKPTPQQVEEDVLVGSHQAPPPKLEVSSRHNGLLEDLVILGYVPVPEAVVRGMGLVHQDRSHQLPEGLASSN